MSEQETYRVLDLITPWVDDAIDAHGMGEDVRWDGALVPDASGEPSLVLFVWIKGPVIGQPINGSIRIPGSGFFGLDAKNVDETIKIFLGKLFEARSRALTLPSGTPPLAVARTR